MFQRKISVGGSLEVSLDECVPSPLRKLLADHECQTAQEMGWKSIRNGELLALAEGKFDLFITADQSKPLPQNYATPSRPCPAQSSVVLKFPYKIVP